MICLNSKSSKAGQAAFLSWAVLLFSVSSPGQLKESKQSDEEFAMAKASLVSDLQILEARARRLDKPLSRALAEAEIADAAWAHDGGWAQGLLREAYELTLPGEEERAKWRRIPIGSPPVLSGPARRARAMVGGRILQVASRDKGFATELGRLTLDELGTYEGHMEYAFLADNAIKNGDTEAASHYIQQAIDADPTQIATLSAIEGLAARDRAAADIVILQYIERLRFTPVSFRNGSQGRVFYSLGKLVLFPNSGSRDPTVKILPPGPAVMRAYAIYILNNLTRLEQESPGSTSHGWLLAIWPLLKQHAPELVQQFMDLEQRSRKPGENFSLPSAKKMAEENKAKYDNGVDRELESGSPDEMVIRLAISRSDFLKARKMIDKLADGPLKIQLTEMLNAQQAISLANKGDIPGAQKLAEGLVRATSILRVFPVIAGKCVAKKDEDCARDAVNQAVMQLKRADRSPETPPPGIPASIFPNSQEYDPVLAGLSSLALAVMSVKDELALDVLDELVIAANHSELDTSLGRTGFETSLFKKLADKNEARVNLAALQLKDPLRQIVALAAIDQWKSDKLAAEAKLRSTKNESSSKKN